MARAFPYTQTGPARESSSEVAGVPDGYGGFRVPSLPYYQAVQGKLWLERGGTTVIANIRGGGEFGTPWHEAGRRRASGCRMTTSPPSLTTWCDAA